jgi:hypothetical protein
MTPSSHRLESPAIPGRFSFARKMLALERTAFPSGEVAVSVVQGTIRDLMKQIYGDRDDTKK